MDCPEDFKFDEALANEISDKIRDLIGIHECRIGLVTDRFAMMNPEAPHNEELARGFCGAFIFIGTDEPPSNEVLARAEITYEILERFFMCDLDTALGGSAAIHGIQHRSAHNLN